MSAASRTGLLYKLGAAARKLAAIDGAKGGSFADRRRGRRSFRRRPRQAL